MGRRKILVKTFVLLYSRNGNKRKLSYLIKESNPIIAEHKAVTAYKTISNIGEIANEKHLGICFIGRGREKHL